MGRFPPFVYRGVENSPTEAVVMDTSRTSPYAILILRVTLGALFLIHAAIKLLVFGPAGTARYFTSLGLPPSLAYVIIAWELIGGIALVLGICPRVAAILMIPELTGTIVVTHAASGFLF